MPRNNNYSTHYANFDIETSKVLTDEGTFLQVTYLTNVIITNSLTGEVVESHFFRDMDESLTFLETIGSKKQPMIVFVHNLDYDLTFLLRERPLSSVMDETKIDEYGNLAQQTIYRNIHSPLRVILEGLENIEFRDSYALSNKNVASMGKEVGMLKGSDDEGTEYDYSKVRLPFDELSQEDYDYCYRDNVIVSKWLYKCMKERDYSLETLPLTFTALTKKDRKRHITEKYGEDKIGSLVRTKLKMYDTYEFYIDCVQAYVGGTTTANPNLLGELVKGVYSADIKSSYPSVMCANLYPKYDEESTTVYYDEDADNFFLDYLDGLDSEGLLSIDNHNTVGVKGYIGRFQFYGVKVKNENYFRTLSASKVLENENMEVINGKVNSADMVSVMFTNVGLDVFNLIYDYEDVYCDLLYVTTKYSTLHDSERSFALQCFNGKENINKNGTLEEQLEYALSKVNLNSLYGIKVQKTIKDSHRLVDGEIEVTRYYRDDFTEEERKAIYENYCEKNEGVPSFDIFNNGVYITDYARYNLIKCMVQLVEEGFIPVYCDTDSIKFTTKKFLSVTANGKELKNNDILKTNKIVTRFFERVNKSISDRNKNDLLFIEFKNEKGLTDEQFNKITKLGTWEIESEYINENGESVVYPYLYFKTLGAKKYGFVKTKCKGGKLIEELETTIAGCSKKVSDAIIKFAELEGISLGHALNFIFSVGTMFDESCSGRTVSKREDRDRDYCRSLTYKGKALNQCGGIIIEDTTYTLNISKNDEEVLDIDRADEVKRVLTKDGELLTHLEYLKRKGVNNE